MEARRFTAIIAATALLAGASACWGRPPSIDDLPVSPLRPALTAAQTRLPLYPLLSHYKLRELGTVYRLAADGALETNYRERYGGAGWRYNPVAASLFCLKAYNLFVVEGGDDMRDHVLRQSSALLARAKRHGARLIWEYDFPQATFGAEPGWISGMAQGLAMGCLAAAHQVRPDARWLEGAAGAFEGMVAPFGKTGTATKVGEGMFYEEVAGEGVPPAQILNGQIFALAGVWLAIQADDRPRYREALEAGIAGVRSVLDEYDVPGSSLYDLGPKRIARLDNDYNMVHVGQLQWLYDISGDPRFLEVASNFLRYERSIPYSVTASVSTPDRDPAALRGTGRYWSSPGGVPAVLDVTLEQEEAVDRVDFIAYTDRSVPDAVTVEVGKRRARIEPDSRFFSVTLAAQRTERVRVHLTPRGKQQIGLFLMTFSNRHTRSLTALASDLDSYYDAGGQRKGARHETSALNVRDRDRDTGWRSNLDRPWLLVDLREREAPSLTFQRCDTHRAFDVRFTKDLRRWTAATTIAATDDAQVRAPAGATFMLLQWPGEGGCLKEIEER